MTWNIPNLLTMARLALLPCVVALIWPGCESRERAMWATMTYILAGILDVVDGVIARRCNQVTAFGKFLDPLADKLFYLITLLALMQLPGPWVPPWVVMVSLSREFIITGLRGIAMAEGVTIAAGEGGKVKTSFATAGVCGLLVHYPFAIHLGLCSFVLDSYKVGLVLTYISLMFAITSGVGYVRGFLAAKRPSLG